MHRLPCIFTNLQADLAKLYESEDCSPLKTVPSVHSLGVMQCAYPLLTRSLPVEVHGDKRDAYQSLFSIFNCGCPSLSNHLISAWLLSIWKTKSYFRVRP